MSNFTNSPLVRHTRLSPHRNSPRNQPIRKITIHHTAGNIGLEALGEFLNRPATRASYNYGISTDGRIGLFVNERDRCWGSSSGENDHQAVVIGVANNTGSPNWGISDAAYESLLNLVICICRRNNITELVYDRTRNGTLTRHNFFAATTCPGPFLQNRFPAIAEAVNRVLGASSSQATPPQPGVFRVGDIVQFNGTQHFTSSNAANGVAARPGRARITQVASTGRRPFHLVAERGGGSNVHGWVNMLDVVAIPAPPTTPPPPPQRTPEEITVDNAIAAGIITDRAHWLGVLTGTVQPRRENIKIVLDRSAELARR